MTLYEKVLIGPDNNILAIYEFESKIYTKLFDSLYNPLYLTTNIIPLAEPTDDYIKFAITTGNPDYPYLIVTSSSNTEFSGPRQDSVILLNSLGEYAHTLPKTPRGDIKHVVFEEAEISYNNSSKENKILIKVDIIFYVLRDNNLYIIQYSEDDSNVALDVLYDVYEPIFIENKLIAWIDKYDSKIYTIPFATDVFNKEFNVLSIETAKGGINSLHGCRINSYSTGKKDLNGRQDQFVISFIDGDYAYFIYYDWQGEYICARRDYGEIYNRAEFKLLGLDKGFLLYLYSPIFRGWYYKRYTHLGNSVYDFIPLDSGTGEVDSFVKNNKIINVFFHLIGKIGIKFVELLFSPIFEIDTKNIVSD